MGLRRDLVKLARHVPETRRFIVPLLKKYASEKAAAFPRMLFLPARVRNQPPLQPEGTDLSIWSWVNDQGKWESVAFIGRQSTPFWNQAFRSESDLQRQIEWATKKRREVLEYKQERQRLRREFQHNLQVGDILYATWGYDQTNANFYQVTSVTGKAVTVRELASETVETYRGGESVKPIPNKFIGGAIRKIPQRGLGGEPVINVNSSIRATPWNGRPVHVTGGWGGH